MNQPISKEVEAGQSVYKPWLLRIYDIYVLGISNYFIWKCPTHIIVKMFKKNITDNHLDIGVGTGFFLSRCKFKSKNPRIVLADLNPNSLFFASNRIKRYHPQTLVHNIFDPFDSSLSFFDSISINYLLHCLPGSLNNKINILDHCLKVLNPNGIIFGSTILQGEDIPRSKKAKKLMRFYNEKGIFSNINDRWDDLEKALKGKFNSYHIERKGCVAVFWGRK